MITAEDVIRWLPIDKHRLDDELERQATIGEEIGRRVTDAEQDVTVAKDDLDRCEARLLIDYKSGEDKMSEKEIAARIATHRERSSRFDAVLDAQRNLSTWKRLGEAWKNRGYDIKTLSELYSASYWSTRMDSTYDRRDRDDDIHRREPAARERRRMD